MLLAIDHGAHHNRIGGDKQIRCVHSAFCFKTGIISALMNNIIAYGFIITDNTIDARNTI